MSDEPRKGLGRGLSALLGEDVEVETGPERPMAAHTVPIEQVSPGKFQPRQRFDDEEMNSLVESVAAVFEHLAHIVVHPPPELGCPVPDGPRLTKNPLRRCPPCGHRSGFYSRVLQ